MPGQWVDLPPLGGTLKEPFEIKVYEIDDVERLQRRREGLAGTEVRLPSLTAALASWRARALFRVKLSAHSER